MKLFAVTRAPHWLKLHPVSGIYWVDIYRANAKPRRFTRSTKISGNKDAAKEKGERMITRWLGAGLDGSKERLLFSDVAEQVLQHESTNRPRTYSNAKIYLGQLLKEFGHMYIDQINAGLWKNFETKFRLANPEKHFFNLHKHMSLVMNHAYRLGLLSRPWEQATPKDKIKPARVLTDEEKGDLLFFASERLKHQLTFAMTMGMRLREHLLLSWEQCDMKAKTIRLDPEHTKTKKGRVINMSAQVYGLLRKLKKDAESPYVFPAPGNPDKPMWSNKTAWRAAKRKAGIKGRCRYHDLRHTFLTECAKLARDGKASVAMICAYCGVSIRVFERTYLHLTHEDTKSVAEMVAVKLR